MNRYPSSYAMIDLMLSYYGVAQPEKKPSEMTLEEWAFCYKALEKIRKAEGDVK